VIDLEHRNLESLLVVSGNYRATKGSAQRGFFSMRIQVRFFASLRERLGVSALELSLPEGATVAQVWARASNNQPIPDNLLAARNMEYVDLSSSVADGDEIGFFPPVTGG